MSSLLKLRRGSTLSHETFTGADGEVTFNTDTNQLVSHDGATAGGFPHTKEADLAASSGSSLVGYLPSGASAEPTDVQSKLRERVSVLDFGADPTGATNSRPAIQAAINYLIATGGGGVVHFPRGTYSISSVASLDANPNGILLPGTGADFSTANGIKLIGEGNETVLRAQDPNMIVIRNSRLYTTIESLRIEGAGVAGVIGIGIMPENQTQTTLLTSTSFFTASDLDIENCAEGMKFVVGPSVLGSDSGCFYHTIDSCRFNLNTRHVWMIKDITATGNRVTRTTFFKCSFLRGNTGVQIDGGTEIDFLSCNFEMIQNGVSPSATPVAINYADPNPANIRLIGGYSEACTRAIIAAHPEQVSLINFRHSSVVDPSEGGMLTLRGGALNIPRTEGLGFSPVYISGINSGFAGLVIDPNQDNSKTMVVQTNGNTNFGWFNRTTTHYGTLGNITMNASGASMTFSYAGGGNSINSPSPLSHVATQHSWSTIAAGEIVTMTGAEFIPRVDNATSFGISGLRWAAVWAANGTIQTSDPRTKKDITDSALGLDFIMKLRPVSYKFIVGSNEIVGKKEVTPAVMDIDSEGKEYEVEAATYEAVTEAKPGKRNHYGFLTTEVKAALGDIDFGGYVKIDPTDPDSEEALRYDQFIAPLVKAVQELTARLQVLEAK